MIILAVALANNCYGLEEVVTVPAEDPAGVLIELPSGEYIARIESGAVSLHFPIHPNYRWLYAVSIGTNVGGAQDEANIGRLFVEPEEKALTQTEAEAAALKALEEDREGTQVAFRLSEKSKVRFWVSDYDYSDNSGSEKIRIYSVER